MLQVTLLGSVGDITQAGGVALRRDSQGSRKAYVSDVLKNRIMVFDLQNFQSNIVAGDLMGAAGSADGYFPGATFHMPMGIAFIEKNMNSSKMLLVADFGNARIRIVDTDARVVSTWFRPLDKTVPEMVAPSALTVALTSTNGLPMIYVTDSGNLNVIQYPVSSDSTVKILSHISIAGGMSPLNIVNGMPYGSASAGLGNSVGFNQVIIQDSLTHSIKAFVQDQVALTAAGGSGPSTCHLACENPNCGALQPAELCGNSFLDPGEQCDDGGAPGGGCDSTCHIRTGFTCPLPLQTCLEPCPAFPYAPTGVSYCTQDCSALTPPSGFTVDAQCVLHDIDECKMGTANCGPAALCTNTIGSYTCGCTSTYFGDGITCVGDAYAVYTLIDIPSYPSSLFQTALLSGTLDGPVPTILGLLKNTYAQALVTFLPPTMLNVPGYIFNTSELAVNFTSVSIDPTIQNFTRLEIVTLFATFNMATAAASGTTPQVLSIALSEAIFNRASGINVFQAPMVRLHSAMGFGSPNPITGWGMNITAVTYNRTCVVTGVTPTGGCWQVEMIYMGGEELPNPDESQPAIQQSKNVLYVPRIDHNPTTMALLNPSQTLTESSGMFFPCSTTSASAGGVGITRAATACCLRDFEATYRPNALFSTFLNSPDFLASVPQDYCNAQSTFNDTYPPSNIVFDLPPGNAETNDLVVGKIEGMPNSEVRLLETIDYTTRTFRVLLVLEEGDLSLSASTMQGMIGGNYNLTFFVGLTNFLGTGGSVLSTRNVQQFITVSKSDTLTLSTYGANQDPLVNAVDMQLVRIKVTDFFQPVQYLYYLQPLFTMPSTYTASASGVGIVPVQSIRLIKTSGTASETDPSWLQACAGTNNNYIYANTSLQNLVAKAQNEACVQSYLQMCTPPQVASSLVTFGIPLPIGMITASDLTANPAETIEVQFVVDAFDTVAKSEVLTTLSLSVQISALGLIDDCETQTASSTLADIITGNIYIGTATNDYEWTTTLQKKTNMDVPGSTPSNSLQFETTTVQGAIMTFTALGDPTYFQDARALTQSVNINDIHTVNFLEPLGGASGPTPNFDAVKALFLAGNAFAQVTDPTNHTTWLEPTEALLAICPLKPTIGHMVCITKVDSTIKNNVLTRNPNTVVELRPGDPTSIPEVQNLMGQVLLQGGSDGFTQMLGTNFSNELVQQLNLNTRYRKAYVVNPVVDWSYQAMQSAQPGSTAYTVCSKIIAIAMITINSPSGTQLARRLLSTTFDVIPEQPTIPVPGRALLQAAAQQPTSLVPTTTQTSNSMVLAVNAPGYDAVTQLCSNILGVSYNKCVVLQFQSQVSGSVAADLCLAESQGVLGTNLGTELQNALVDPQGISQIAGFFLLDYSISGCPTSAAGRRLLQTSSELIVLLNKVMLSSNNGTVIISPQRLNALTDFLNSTSTWTTILGGGGFVYSFSVSQSNNGQLVSFNISIGNPQLKNNSQIQTAIQGALGGNGFSQSQVNDITGDVMFNNVNGQSSDAHSLVAFTANTLVALALCMALSGV